MTATVGGRSRRPPSSPAAARPSSTTSTGRTMYREPDDLNPVGLAELARIALDYLGGAALALAAVGGAFALLRACAVLP